MLNYTRFAKFYSSKHMAENQPMNPMPTGAPMAPKKAKNNFLTPVLIVFVAIAAFMAVWYLAVR